MNPTDLSIIAQLEQRIELQESQLQQQARQLQQLQTQFAAMQNQGNSSEDVTPERYQASGGVLTQLDSHAKAITNLHRELDKGQRYEEQLAVARHDYDRLHKEATLVKDRLDKLQHYIEERVHSLTYFEEQRRNDSRRLSELQAELPNLQRKVETAVLAKIQVVERQMPQFAEYQMELEKIREDIRRDRQAMDYQVAQRERQIKLWLEQAESHEQRIHKYTQSLERYEDQYLTNRRTLEALQDFQERLERDQHQTGELQRLSEERQLAAFDKWKAEYEQRWQSQNSQWKPGFSDLQRTLQALQNQITEIQKFNRTIEQQLDLVLRIMEEDVQHRSGMAEQWQRRFEEIASQG